MKQQTMNIVGRLKSTRLRKRFSIAGRDDGFEPYLFNGYPTERHQPSVPTAPAHTTTYGRAGSLEVRLASSHQDVQQAQRLRYDVFFEEMSATPSIATRLKRRDEDPFDAICDHLLVVDHATHQGPDCQKTTTNKKSRPQVTGTYRLLRQDVAERRNTGFYTQSEYDIAPLIAAQGPDVSFLELGRSCVLKPYRNKRTVELLWHGLWTYIRQHKIDVMIGCASFEGTNPADHAMALSYLRHNARAPRDWAVCAHKHLYQPMDLVPADQLDVRYAIKTMPPLIKGYLRLGAFVGDGAIIDHEFGTTDVLVILPVGRINPRYFARFGGPDELTSRLDPRSIR